MIKKNEEKKMTYMTPHPVGGAIKLACQTFNNKEEEDAAIWWKVKALLGEGQSKKRPRAAAVWEHFT